MKCTRICDRYLALALMTAVLYSVEGEDAFIKFQQNLEGKEYCSLPMVLSLTLSTGSETLQVNLRRNDHIHPNVPTFTIITDESGVTEFRMEEPQTKKNHAAYQEPHHEVAVMVTCHLHAERGSQYEMEGTLFLKSKKFRILPSKSPLTFYQRLFHSADEKVYHLLSAKEDVPFDAGIKALDHERILANTLEEIHLPPVREKRDAEGDMQEINIDVLVVLEYSVIKTWTAWAGGNQTQGTENAKIYFTLLMNAVNLRFKNINSTDYSFAIRLTAFVTSDNANSSPWSKDIVNNTGGLERINASKVLENLKNWIGNTSDTVPPHDHAMLFTSYDLIGDDSGFRFNYTTGLAYVDTMCNTDGSSVSVVEDHGGFQSVGTATHELGHSLGARHDGEKNRPNCKGIQRFIMAPLSYNETEATKFNPWFFSKCSVEAFVEFIKTSNKTECLTGTLSPVNVPNVTEAPGQVYSPDEQCRHLFGNKSYLCRGIDFDVNALICRAMFCYKPETTICLLVTAARGTICGNKRWCINGACTESEEAPAVSDTCPHGDQPYVRVNIKNLDDDEIEMTCPDAINNSSHFCYLETWKIPCCQSCGQISNGTSECEYGDRLPGCEQETCMYYNKTELKTCCKTCENYEPTTGPQTSMSPTSTDPSPTTCKDERNPLGTCKTDIDDIGIFKCYTDVNVSCCSTCQELADPKNKACPWGDRSPSSCYPLKKYLGEGVCPNSTTIKHYCCGTCADLSNYFSDLNTNTAPVQSSTATINTNIILQNVVNIATLIMLLML